MWRRALTVNSSPRVQSNHIMAVPPVVLTKDYILNAFKPLEETEDVEKRTKFFKMYMVENVTWNITGSAHDLVGTRYSLAEHNSATFGKLGTDAHEWVFILLREYDLALSLSSLN